MKGCLFSKGLQTEGKPSQKKNVAACKTGVL